MGLETGTYISDLVASNPVNATDPVSHGDDHLRLIKSTLLNTFPNIDGAMNATQEELNYMVGVTSGVQSQLDGKAASSHNHNASAINAGTMANARIAEANVTQHEAALTILEAQISDLGNYLEPGDVASTLSIGNADTTLSRDGAGQLAVEGRAVFTHEDASLVNSRIHISTSAPTGGDGNDGDIWLEREA